MARNKRRIPELRKRLRELAEELNFHELHDIADELHRNPPVSRARIRSETLTPELAEEIRQYVKKNPDLHQRDVAQRFNVNPGRISEALNHHI